MKRTAAFFLFLGLASCANAAPPQVGYTVFDVRIDDKSSEKLVEAIAMANKIHLKVLVIVLDSHGGDLDSGYRIIKTIEQSQTKIVCLVDTRAYSMAFGVLQSCPIRVATKRSTLMAHQSHTAAEEGTTEVQAQNLHDRLAAWNEGFAVQCARRLLISLEEYKKRVGGDREWWMTPEEALKVGALDQVVDSLQEVMIQAHKMVETPTK